MFGVTVFEWFSFGVMVYGILRLIALFHAGHTGPLDRNATINHWFMCEALVFVCTGLAGMIIF